MTVTCQDAERPLAWPVVTRLYLPEEWAGDEARRQRAPIPQARGVATKAASALALRDEAPRCGVKPACVSGDAEYGDNPNFLQG